MCYECVFKMSRVPPVFNKKTLKIGTQGNNQHFFHDTLKTKIKKKCFKNRPITKFGMPKKNDA